MLKAQKNIFCFYKTRFQKDDEVCEARLVLCFHFPLDFALHGIHGPGPQNQHFIRRSKSYT